jgi:hypothetical protein
VLVRSNQSDPFSHQSGDQQSEDVLLVH